MTTSGDAQRPAVEWITYWSLPLHANLADESHPAPLIEITVDAYGNWAMYSDLDELRSGSEASAALAKQKVGGEIAAIADWWELAKWRGYSNGRLEWWADILPQWQWTVRHYPLGKKVVTRDGTWEGGDLAKAKQACEEALADLWAAHYRCSV